MKNKKKVVVIGASGGSGRKTVEALHENGHDVTAVSRSASKVFGAGVRAIDGSALNREILRRSIEGQDAVIITLGISENPIRVRFFGPANTPINIRSEGTKSIIEVMKEYGVKRLLVQTTYGSGPTKGMLRVLDALLFKLLLKPQIDDTEIQDKIVRECELDWTIIQPVHLTDRNDELDDLFRSNSCQVSMWSISRSLVGKFLANAISDHSTLKETVSISQRAI